jgi:hypothetical protein
MFFLLLGNNLFSQSEDSALPDKMPFFPGCDHIESSETKRTCSNKNLLEYIRNNLELPEEARELGIEGLVYISFFVTKSGEVKDAYIIKDIGGGCGMAAKQVIETMPHWLPAFKNGKPVAVQMSIPIKFSFSDQEKSNKGYFIVWGDISGHEISEDQLNSLIDAAVELRDINGDLVVIHELILSFKKRRKEFILKNRKALSPEMKKQIRKLDVGDQITLSLSYQNKGNFYNVLKEYVIKA